MLKGRPLAPCRRPQGSEERIVVSFKRSPAGELTASISDPVGVAVKSLLSRVDRLGRLSEMRERPTTTRSEHGPSARTPAAPVEPYAALANARKEREAVVLPAHGPL